MTLASRTSEVRFVQKGPQGNKGAKLRITDWAVGQQCLEGKEGEEWYDVKVYNSKLYLCIKSHTSSTANNPQTSVANNLGYWALATDWQFVATKLLLAEKIKADQIDADGITAKDVNITGTINADDGYFRGTIETAASGKRIIISPETNSFRMIDAYGKQLVTINFSSIEGYDVGLIRMDAYQGGQITYSTDVSPTHVSISGPLGTTMITSQTLLAQDASAKNNVEISPKAISIKFENSQYSGVDGEYNIAVGGYSRTLKFVHGVLVSVK